MLNSRFLNIVLLSALILFSVSCKKKNEEKNIEEPVFSEEVARVVNYVSSGSILSNDPVRIEFVDDQVEDAQVGVEIENEIFTITPKVKGKVVWSSNKIVTFVPEQAWEARKNYTIKCELSKISTMLAEIDDDLEFGIYVEGQEIELFSGELVLNERNDPKALKYVGKVAFKLPVTKEQLEKAVYIKKGSKTLKVALVETGSENTYTYESEILVRGSKAVTYKLVIDQDELDLSDDYISDFEITPLQKMLVRSVSAEETGRHPRLRVVFSDDIDLSQDITSYFTVSPEVSLKISKSGNNVVVDGAFKFGEEYKLTVKPGVSSRWATTLASTHTQSIKFSDLAPSVEFASDGIILPTSNNSKLQFLTSNLSRVHIQVKKVFHNQVSDFIRQEEISGAKQRRNGFTRNYGGQVGVIVLNKTLELGDTKNEWLLNEIDLSSIIGEDSEGLYLVRLNFNPRDILVGVDESTIDYVADNGSVFKPIVVSNLGITAKKDDDGYYIWVTDLISGKPVSGADVYLYRYWGDDYEEYGSTSSSGYEYLSSDYSCSYITAEKNGQISYLKLDNMQWNTSGFDVTGVSSNYSGQRSFIYTERGVYRPGDEINLSIILRNQDNSFPSDQPVTLTLYNPDGQNVYETTNNDGEDGLFVFKLKTKDSDPTGNWEARIYGGSGNYYHTIKVETVVPFKLKVRTESETKKISAKDAKYDFKVRSNYLFGTPAAGLKYETEVQVSPRKIYFPKYQNFSFSNDLSYFSSFTRTVDEGTLDTAGVANLSWVIPQFEKVSSGLSARFVTTVYEKGGRPNTSRTNVAIDNYENYVGIQKPGHWYHYVTTNEESSLQVICVNTDGEPVSGKKLLYRIYQNNSHWWYQYDSRREYQLRYKTDNNTTLVKEGSITSANGAVNLKFTPREDGDYLIEIQEGGYDGHVVSQFVYAYAWGSVPSGDQNAGTLILKADKAKYHVGDVAKVRFPAPAEGAVLMSLEKEDEIIEWRWLENKGEKGKDMEVSIPITAEMVPNSYLNISVIQPHAQTSNDRPMRMFGILPLFAEDSNTRREIDIKVADELKPNKPFEVTVQTKDNKSAWFTIAVVDEGLLDLTNFQTPNPWREFFKKLRLGIDSYDVFSQVIGVNKGDVFKTFSIGGDMDFQSQQLDPMKGKKRFKPVSMFKGPIATNASGKATVQFDMPDYNGSVRIMVVAVDGHSYGNAEATVPVRTDLMIQPSIPRVLGPDEEFTIPVNVFAMKDNVGKVDVSLKLEGPLEVVGKSTSQVSFKRATDKEVFFRVKTKKSVGQAKITILANSSKVKVNSKTDIMVRPSSPRQYKTDEQHIKIGETAVFTIPNDGISGTNTAQLKVQLFPNMNFGHRLDWLIRYPYGCVEQTTSSVFPQLYLSSFMSLSDSREDEISKNINAGIQRLQRFQTSSGGMGYWPGSNSVSEWSSIYVAHFLVEAQNKGYHIPSHLFDNLMNYLERQSRYANGEKFTRVYRVYVLSMAQKSVLSEVNKIWQDEELTSVQKYMIAAAYHNLGKKETAAEIVEGADDNYSEYEEFSYHFGSVSRDMGAVLSTLVDMDEKENSRVLAEEIARIMSDQRWYSTHSLSYMLLSLGKYFDMIGLDANGNKNIEGYYEIDGVKHEFDNDNSVEVQLTKGFGKELKVHLSNESDINSAYTTLSWSGVPIMDTRPAAAENINLTVEWLDELGRSIDPSKLAQATTIYGHYKVSKNSPLRYINEVALVQILPSGWEIENLRLSEDQLPAWTSDLRLNYEEYLDIRDDRIMWFFDISDNPLDFIVKVNVVTQGSFYMPPTIVEAMYNNNYRALVPGQKVQVVGMGK